MAAKPSTLVWVAIHLLTPLVPFAIEGCIRLVVRDGVLALNTFRAQTLAMSMGLTSVFVNQSLRTFLPQLADETEVESIVGASMIFSWLSTAFFVLFGVLALLNALVSERGLTDLSGIFDVFQCITFVSCAVPLCAAVVAQRSFKLRASVR
jgi:hypothetical protein